MFTVLLFSAGIFFILDIPSTFAKARTSKDCQIHGEPWYYHELWNRCCPCMACQSGHVHIFENPSVHQDCQNFHNSRGIKELRLCVVTNRAACCTVKQVKKGNKTGGCTNPISFPKPITNAPLPTTLPTKPTTLTTTNTTPPSPTISFLRSWSFTTKTTSSGGNSHVFIVLISILTFIIIIGICIFCFNKNSLKLKCPKSLISVGKKPGKRQDEIIKRDEENQKEPLTDESSTSSRSSFASQTDSNPEKKLLSPRTDCKTVRKTFQRLSNEETSRLNQLPAESEEQNPNIINSGSNNGVIANIHKATGVHIHHHYNSSGYPNPPVSTENPDSYPSTSQPSTGVPPSFRTSDYGQDTLPKYPSDISEKVKPTVNPRQAKSFMSRDEHPLNILSEKVNQDCLGYASPNFSVQESRFPTEHTFPNNGYQFDSGETEVKELQASTLTNDQFEFSREYTKPEVPRDDQSDNEGSPSSGSS